ncbi:efflux ABC transporter, permease domain protein [Bordetella bronchiseptica B20-10725633]|nr:efflux ABC transporter, permease domain protein [Bordetella bronchiseptica B20-10725633]
MLPGNPLPDAVVVTLADGENLAGRAGALAQDWGKWDGVDQVQLDSAWVQRLEALLRFARIGLAFLAACVAVVVLATVFNTVRMQAMTQREEIAVARLVGATESFVRRPFLYQGALTGAVSALIAIGAPQIRPCPAGQSVQPLVVDLDGSAAWRLQAADQLEQCRLAGARRPGHEDELSSADAKVDVGQDISAAPVRFEDVLEFNHGEV